MTTCSTADNICHRYILEKDFPGMRIGPEPTTDTFHVVDYAGQMIQNCTKKSFKSEYSNLPQWQKRMGTSLATCWLLTQRNLTHISKTTGEPSSPGERSGIDQHWSLVRFQCSTTKSPVLKSVTLLDTPGIISLTLTEPDTWIGIKKTKNRHPRWREADPEQRLWLHRGPQVVCGKSRQVKK